MSVSGVGIVNVFHFTNTYLVLRLHKRLVKDIRETSGVKGCMLKERFQEERMGGVSVAAEEANRTKAIRTTLMVVR